MRTHRVLIVYGTKYGHTAKIAARLEGLLVAGGVHVARCDASELGHGLDLERFDGVIVAASVIGGKHQRAVQRFIMHHLEALNRLPSMFLSVSGSAASANPARRSDARQLMERYLAG